MLIKKLSVIGAVLSIGFSLSTFAASSLELAKRSHQLSVNIKNTSLLETNSFCQYKLDGASTIADEAGNLYMSNDIDLAKYMIKDVSNDLAYTSVEDCSQASAISIYKKEADDILSLSQ